MRRMRRTNQDARIEITPMIDVVFLLLTFFIFSIVLMVRADVLDLQLPELGSGTSPDRVVPITLAITDQGELLLNREPVQRDRVINALEQLRADHADAPIVLAVDTRSNAGVLLELVDELTGAGIDSFSVIGERSIPDPAETP